MLNEALRLLLDKIEALDEKLKTAMVVLRDFAFDKKMNEFLHNHAFLKIDMPESCVMSDLNWNTVDEYVASYRPRSRKHFRADIQPYEKYFDIEFKPNATDKELEEYYTLYENVRAKILT